MPDGFDPSMLFLGDPQGMAQILAIQRQRALAERLMGSQPIPTTIGGYPTGPGAFLASGVNNVLGAYEARKADEAQAKLYGGLGQGGGLLNGPRSFQPTDTGQVSNEPKTAPTSQEATPKQAQQQEQPHQRSMLGGPFGAAIGKSLGFTPEMENALAATGGDWDAAAELVRGGLVKGGTVDLRPGGTAIGPNGVPFSAPAAPPAGSQVQWGPNGPQINMVPGAAAAISQSTAAEAYPKAQAEAYGASITPKPITPGAGEVFGTPAGGPMVRPNAPMPPSLPNPTVNLIGGPGPSTAAQPNLGSIPGIPTSQLSMSPQGLNWMKSEGPAQLEQVKNDAEAAQDAHYQLANLTAELKGLGTQGFLAPGKGADTRIAIAKWINSISRTQGVAPPDWASNDKIAAAEGALKTGGRLGFALSRSLGAREAAQIVQQAISLNPGIMNTPQGNALVTRSMDAVAQRQADRNIFFTQWMQKYGNTFNADVAFNQTHPIGSYVGLATAPDRAAAALKANPHLATDFDAKYGQGASDRVLRAPW